MPSPLVHVIDDDDAARESLAFLLSANRFEVRSYDAAKTFLSGTPWGADGCVITDMRMPEMDGLELIRHLTSHRIGLPVIAVTGQDDVSLAVEAMREGAADFIEKPFNDGVVLSAVRCALNLQERDSEKRAIRMRLAALSPRERQVLDALATGQSHRGIADNLGVSVRVIEIHRANIMAKMEATSLLHLVRTVLIAEK
jgi:two-component system response regulator FixJ